MLNATTKSSCEPTRRSRIRLNIGCGHVQPADWVNLDNSNRAKLASRLPWLDRLFTWLKLLPATEFNRNTRTANVCKRIPCQDGTVDTIYCGELLEHFTLANGQQFLAECFRVLVPGGVLRLRVPDNYRFWKNYTVEYESVHTLARADWTDEHSRWVQMFFRDICVVPPGLRSMGHYHKWMYDDISLILTLERQGFVQVERRAFHESRIPDVALVEMRDDLIVEGIKPA